MNYNFKVNEYKNTDLLLDISPASQLNLKKNILSDMGLNYSNIELINNIDITKLDNKQKKYIIMFKNSITNELNSIIEMINNNTINEINNDSGTNSDFGTDTDSSNITDSSTNSDSSINSDILSNLLTEQIFNIEQYLNTIIEMTKELNITL
tara:strand:+ start:288 stop:743 length:456 start_codon:yes stop_codon:yes gene_type:complete